MYAIIENFNKQFIVRKNEIISLSNIDNKKYNKFIEFNKILLLFNNSIISLGKPYIDNAKVLGIIINTFKDKKINILKFKRRKHYIKRKNYRQIITKIKIVDIIYNLK